jgi:hypothetical protein
MTAKIGLIRSLAIAKFALESKLGLNIDAHLYEMNDFDVAPFLPEVFGDEPAMTTIGPILAAKQASSIERRSIDHAFDSPFLHQFQKRPFINAPIPFPRFVSGKELLRGGEQR